MKTLFIILILIGMFRIIFAQSVGVGTTMPNASAALDVSSVTQGMLVPRMTTAQRTLISSPAQGLLVFDLTTNSFWFRNASSWVQLIDSVSTEVHKNGPDKIYMGMTKTVGIGLNTPLNKLDITGGGTRTGSHATSRPLYVTGNIGSGSDGIEFRHENGTQGIGFGYNTIYAASSVESQDLGLAAKGLAGHLLFSTVGYERMRITPLGNVGIGNQFPNAPLQFNNDVVNRKIVLYESANNDHEFFGFGINGSTLRYQVSNTLDNHIFYSGSSSSTSNELMRIRGDGNVGIGTTTPAYKLSVTNKFGIDANGSAHFVNVPRQHYFYEDALPNKMVLSHSPSYPTWGLQYTGANQFKFLADSSAVMTVDLENNNVEINGALKIGHVIAATASVSIAPLSWGSVSCQCPPGTVVLSGGFNWNVNVGNMNKSYPDSTTSWYASAYNNNVFNNYTLYVNAICARLAN